MEQLIAAFVLIPLIGFLANAIIPPKDEVRLAQVSFYMMAAQLIFILVFTIDWIIKGGKTIYYKEMTLLEIDSFELFVDFKYDMVTAVYLLVGAFIAFLITAYSRNYLHREEGYKRFFATILFFYLGYNIIVVSGNLTTIFIGWEIAGISSFLLIAFYRNRFIPVQNAIKIFSIYRLGDISIMLAIWLSHYIWHRDITLNELSDFTDVSHHIHDYQIASTLLAVCILLAASIKSALFPFSAWLPRAMEGPTPSSAIFYSSLAVHLGVLLLLRTYEFWVYVPGIQIVVIALGIITFLIASVTARIQPSIKGQIAYSVVAQIGLITIEIALGWHILALIHIASHAMLRSYQLLISPSIVSYAIKKQFYEFKPEAQKPSSRITNSIYILSLKEWYMDSFIYFLVWESFQKVGFFLHKIPRIIIVAIGGFSLIVLPILAVMKFFGLLDDTVLQVITYTMAILALGATLRVLTERRRVLFAWHKIAFFHFFVTAAMYFNDETVEHLLYYIVGITISYILGHIILGIILKKEKYIPLNEYQGHSYEYPHLEFWFFLACLGLMAFPITSGFIGAELLLNGVKPDQWGLLAILLISFLTNGLAMMRIYSKIFLGPHVKTYHETARKTA